MKRAITQDNYYKMRIVTNAMLYRGKGIPLDFLTFLGISGARWGGRHSEVGFNTSYKSLTSARKKTSGYETPPRLPFGMWAHQEHTNIQTPSDVCSQSWTSSDNLKYEFICSRHCGDMHNITQNCGLSRKEVYTDCSRSIESKPVFYELNLTMIMPCSGVCSSAYVCMYAFGNQVELTEIEQEEVH